MINEEKVKSMTKAAAYECGNEKQNIKISNYYRVDYLGMQMVKSAIAYTVAFALLIFLCGMSFAESLMLKLSQPEYFQNVLKIVAVIFAVGLIAYEFAVYAYYSWQYERAKKSVGEYQEFLKDIHKFYGGDGPEEEDLVEIDLSEEENSL